MKYTNRHDEHPVAAVGGGGEVTLSAPPSSAPGIGARLASGCVRAYAWAGKLTGAFVDWYAIRGTVAALSRLDDHTLADIGIDRSEIVEVARRAVGQGNDSRCRKQDR